MVIIILCVHHHVDLIDNLCPLYVYLFLACLFVYTLSVKNKIFCVFVTYDGHGSGVSLKVQHGCCV